MPARSVDNETIIVCPDSKGRIALGGLAEGVSGFLLREYPGGGFLLEPMVEIPASQFREMKNQAALKTER